MIEADTVEVGFSVLFQLINVVLLLGFLWTIFYLIFRLPKRLRGIENSIQRMNTSLEEIEKAVKAAQEKR